MFWACPLIPGAELACLGGAGQSVQLHGIFPLAYGAATALPLVLEQAKPVLSGWALGLSLWQAGQGWRAGVPLHGLGEVVSSSRLMWVICSPQAAMPSTLSATPAPARTAEPALSAGGPTPASVLLALGAKTVGTVSERALLGTGSAGMGKAVLGLLWEAGEGVRDELALLSPHPVLPV